MSLINLLLPLSHRFFSINIFFVNCLTERQKKIQKFSIKSCIVFHFFWAGSNLYGLNCPSGYVITVSHASGHLSFRQHILHKLTQNRVNTPEEYLLWKKKGVQRTDIGWTEIMAVTTDDIRRT